MKNFYFIISAIYIVIIGAKFWAFQQSDIYFVTPKGLQLLRIVGITLIYISVILMNIRPKLSRIFIILAFISGFSQSIWDYTLGDVGIPYFLFALFAYFFFCFVIWYCTKTESEEILNSDNATYNNK